MKKIIYSPGEPAGIGPDLIIKLAASKKWIDFKVPIVSIGDPKLFLDRADLLGKKIEINEVDSINKVRTNQKNLIHVIKVAKCNKTAAGKIYKSNAHYVLNNLDYAIKQTLHNKRTALVTGPLNKEIIISIDKKFTGHTEYIQKITKSNGVLMMLASDQLRVALATTHIPIKDVAKTITKELIINKVKILNNDLKTKFNIKNPHIKILGLNPHAGENGKIGTEELLHIKPAIKDLKKKKYKCLYAIISRYSIFEKKLKRN